MRDTRRRPSCHFTQYRLPSMVFWVAAPRAAEGSKYAVNASTDWQRLDIRPSRVSPSNTPDQPSK
eukprot:15454276-Alexandrium_andersonii.AAC.1